VTFTRLSDSDTLIPDLVFGPIEVEREVRTIVRELLHSSAVRATYVPTTNRYGEFQLLFSSHAEARTAAAWFDENSMYSYAGPDETFGGGLVFDDGFLVEVEPTVDASFDTTFIVTGGALAITQNSPRWELRVPYKEVVL
jgi:hypothetical protein